MSRARAIGEESRADSDRRQHLHVPFERHFLQLDGRARPSSPLPPALALDFRRKDRDGVEREARPNARNLERCRHGSRGGLAG